MGKKVVKEVVCDKKEESCPDRCAHKKPHRFKYMGGCPRGICGGQHTECVEAK